MENEITVNDLNLNESDETEIKGGPKRIFIGGLSVTALSDLEPEGNVMGGRTDGPGSGGPIFNHNETVTDDEEADPLPDLIVETDEQIKGGPGEGSSTAGGVFLNHNETVAIEEEAQPNSLDDLVVENDEQIKGGPTKRIWDYIRNNN